ncbi:hypothetical protein D9M69_497450 [compost metagenome]
MDLAAGLLDVTLGVVLGVELAGLAGLALGQRVSGQGGVSRLVVDGADVQRDGSGILVVVAGDPALGAARTGELVDDADVEQVLVVVSVPAGVAQARYLVGFLAAAQVGLAVTEVVVGVVTASAVAVTAQAELLVAMRVGVVAVPPAGLAERAVVGVVSAAGATFCFCGLEGGQPVPERLHRYSPSVFRCSARASASVCVGSLS